MVKTIHPLRRFAPRPTCLRGTKWTKTLNYIPINREHGDTDFYRTQIPQKPQKFTDLSVLYVKNKRSPLILSPFNHQQKARSHGGLDSEV